MKKGKNRCTEPNRGYIDGIKCFYEEKEIGPLRLKVLQEKVFSENDPLSGRAYLVIQALPDAPRGTVLRPAINWKTGKPSSGERYKGFYNYASKYVGRNSFLHMEIVHKETSWFERIN